METPTQTSAERRDEIAANAHALDQRIETACTAAGRARGEVTVVAVTKTFPWTDVAHLAALGFRDMGENRDQDAAPKIARCRAEGLVGLRWHFVGQLQTNKVGRVAAYADVVHSVDRPRLVGALERAAAAHHRAMTCLVQVDLEDGAYGETPTPGAPNRGGAAPADVADLAARIDASEHLDLGGVMAVAPREGDPATAFARLAEVSAALRSTYPLAVLISAGMSVDLDAAVAAGATHLRVGTALLGSRPPLG